jgi:peroxiredoxin
MQKVLKFTAIAALALASLGTIFAAAPVPRKAPEFVILSTNGKQTLLSSYRGKSVVLALMFTTCPHCQKAAQTLAQLQKEYADKGLQVLGATWDKDAEKNVDQFNRVLGVNFPCGYASSESVMQFLQQPASSPPFVPIIVFIDKTGTIRELRMVTGDDGPDSPMQKWFGDLENNLKVDIDKLLKTGPATSHK